MTTAAMGHQAALSINGTPMAFLSCGLAKRSQFAVREGIRGTRSRYDTDVRLSTYTVSGPVVLEPSYAELSALMALAIGSGGAIAETLTEFDVVVDEVADVTTYADCKVNRATIRGSKGGIVQVALDLVGKTASDAGSVSTPSSAGPIVFSDLTLTLQSAARETESFELVIDNALMTDRFMNSTSVTDIPETDRKVSLTSRHAHHADNAALLGQAVAGAAGTLVLTDGTSTGTFTFGILQVPEDRPEIPGRAEEILMALNMMAHKTGSTAEIAFALT